MIFVVVSSEGPHREYVPIVGIGDPAGPFGNNIFIDNIDKTITKMIIIINNNYYIKGESSTG